MAVPTPARLSPVDAARVGSAGLRYRPARVALAALGISIGVAALVAVLGVSASSRAALDHQLARLGTNLLTVQAGSTVYGEAAQLPTESVPMAARIAPMRAVAATGRIDTGVYRNAHMARGETGGIAVYAADADLLDTLGGTLRVGHWFNPATDRYPAVVLGAVAARKLDTYRIGTRLWLGGRWFTVVGVLEPTPLAPEIDNAALVGWETAHRYLGFNQHPTTLYCRPSESQVEAVRSVLPATVNPQAPHEVRVSRPSDALAAQRATERTLDGLLLGLGAVALLVGGIGIANTMVISVLERRGEIGLRRSLGATRGQVRLQFLIESLLLSALGAAGGVALGSLAAAAYAVGQGWPVMIPPIGWLGGLLVPLPVGVLAGLYPAIRAARVPPVTALAGP
ncbi:ABC transporter permease [Micromonospora sp. PLK6-60]|uniref:ABC transporter permease n=1 Tax=Micromonospora sp. PLK6-60 TaxID=2873383 RepID=UPI001CA73B7B|nr:ABC transporter permease [Micromonospora sp. PLK6-60]MBY8871341.1 ABC transporter permease [Micromonospora sp. PLK6-60]